MPRLLPFSHCRLLLLGTMRANESVAIPYVHIHIYTLLSLSFFLSLLIFPFHSVVQLFRYAHCACTPSSGLIGNVSLPQQQLASRAVWERMWIFNGDREHCSSLERFKTSAVIGNGHCWQSPMHRSMLSERSLRNSAYLITKISIESTLTRQTNEV